MSSVWACVYTRHKTKKAKTWRNGILKVSIDKATLCDADGEVELDSKFLGRGVVVTSDVGVEMDRFLVQVIEKKSGDTLAANDLVVIPVEDQHIQPTE